MELIKTKSMKPYTIKDLRDMKEVYKIIEKERLELEKEGYFTEEILIKSNPAEIRFILFKKGD